MKTIGVQKLVKKSSFISKLVVLLQTNSSLIYYCNCVNILALSFLYAVCCLASSSASSRQYRRQMMFRHTKMTNSVGGPIYVSSRPQTSSAVVTSTRVLKHQPLSSTVLSMTTSQNQPSTSSSGLTSTTIPSADTAAPVKSTDTKGTSNTPPAGHCASATGGGGSYSYTYRRVGRNGYHGATMSRDGSHDSRDDDSGYGHEMVRTKQYPTLFFRFKMLLDI